MAVGKTSQTMDDSQSRNNHEWDHYTIFYWADKIIKLNSPIWILHRWRASRFLVINQTFQASIFTGIFGSRFGYDLGQILGTSRFHITNLE